MATHASGLKAVGGTQVTLQLVCTQEFKQLANKAAQVQNASISSLLRRAFIAYAKIADGVSPELAAEIERCGLQQDVTRFNGQPILRKGVDLSAGGAVQLEIPYDGAAQSSSTQAGG